MEEARSFKTTLVFNKIVDAYGHHPRLIGNEGGARSSKTYSLLQFLVLLAESDGTPKITSVVSETMPHLKRGAIRDFQDIMVRRGTWSDARWSKVDSIYTFPSGSIIEFFSADQPGKVLGPARDRLFVNEAINISWDTFRQLSIRTRGMVFFDYNPAHAFYAHDKLATREDCIIIHSTYKDNPFLSPAQIAEIESNKSDAQWWRVYGEGKVGTFAGTIYDFEAIDRMPSADGLTELYGMDFGFSNDPTACVRILADTGRKTLYVDEVIYETRLLNSDIIRRLEERDVPKRSAPIYADCAEPKSIAEIFNAGYNVKPCDKDAPVRSDKIRYQIQWLQGWQLKVTKRSLNLITELRNYCWAKDKDGNELNQPIDKFNHALDALRYGAFTHLAQRAGAGQYYISIR